MNRPGSRNRKNKKKITGALAGAGIVALVLALMISFGKTAPENPMDRNRADASRMYLLSSTLDRNKIRILLSRSSNRTRIYRIRIRI